MRVSRLTVIAALVAGGLLVTPLSAAAQDGDRDRVAEAATTNVRFPPIPDISAEPFIGSRNADAGSWVRERVRLRPCTL